MGHIETVTEVDLTEPTLVEGLPGIGLVGRIATDHVVEALDMVHFGSVRCPGLPSVAVYESGDRTAYPPVRLYASEADDLVALRSEVPISPSEVGEFADCITGWLADNDGLPVYVSGLPAEVEQDGERELFGVATGDAETLLVDHDIDPPAADGVWTGPTGALLDRAERVELDAVGVIIESDPQFPDPAAACTYINRAINPVAGLDIDDAGLRDRAEEIRADKQEFAQRMTQSGDDSSRAEPLGMYQ